MGPPMAVNEKCRNCRRCLQIGCPAITVEDGAVRILDYFCYGCGVCAKVCPFGAIEPVEKA